MRIFFLFTAGAFINFSRVGNAREMATGRERKSNWSREVDETRRNWETMEEDWEASAGSEMMCAASATVFCTTFKSSVVRLSPFFPDNRRKIGKLTKVTSFVGPMQALTFNFTFTTTKRWSLLTIWVLSNFSACHAMKQDVFHLETHWYHT